MRKNENLAAWVFVGLALCVTCVIYWSGLAGGFVYDDFSFVVGNDGIKVNAGSLREWIIAAMSFPAGSHQGRWLTMLSFGLNHFLAGMDPFWFKATNLGIHLLNGLLVFLALRALFDFHGATRTQSGRNSHAHLIAAAIASLWLVLPINLTAVLYVSQRLESLSTTIVLLALWAYLRVRSTGWYGQQHTGHLALILVVGTGVGVLAKESAILLPLYTALAELALSGFRKSDGRWNRPLLTLYSSLLLLPLIIGLVWLGGWVDGTRSFGRAFDIPERLMTESRILFQYMHWTLAPNLDSLTLYHDDIPISKDLISPPTTLLSILGIAVLLGGAYFSRHRFPLLALGIFWFFGGHVLTATVIPLLLAFEHRNYFPSLGLLLALASLFAIEGLRLRARTLGMAFAALFSFYSFTTAMRAAEWSDPLRLALSEAAKRPNSPSAQYDRAYKLMTSGMQRKDGQPLAEDGLLTLETARKLPGAGILFEQMLITSYAKTHRTIRKEWWNDLVEKLRLRPVNASDAKALHALNACFLQRVCNEGLDSLEQAYAAALSHGAPRPTLLSTHAEFAWHLKGDKQTAERNIRAAVRNSPNDFGARKNLLVLLIATNQLEEAEMELEYLGKMNHLGFYDDLIKVMADALQDQRKRAASAEEPGNAAQPKNPAL